MSAKKRLSEFDFSKQGCHISLVNKEVGYAANGKPALVLKALSPAGDNNDDKEKQVSEMIEKSAVEVMVQKAVQEAVAPLQEILKAKEAEIAQFQEKAKESVQKSRKEALQKAVGDIKAEELMSVVADMNDAGFEVILKSVSAASEQEQKSEMFQEVGANGSAEGAVVKSFGDYLPKKSK